MSDETVYQERLSSAKTEVLFVTLAVVLLSLCCLRAVVSGFGYVAGALLVASAFFVFYAVNYRTLVITINAGARALELRFGVFSWRVPLHTIVRGYVDDTPMWRVGGAGIHFTAIRGRYRVFFNFLEYPRVVLELSDLPWASLARALPLVKALDSAPSTKVWQLQHDGGRRPDRASTRAPTRRPAPRPAARPRRGDAAPGVSRAANS